MCILHWSEERVEALLQGSRRLHNDSLMFKVGELPNAEWSTYIGDVFDMWHNSI